MHGTEQLGTVHKNGRYNGETRMSDDETTTMAKQPDGTYRLLLGDDKPLCCVHCGEEIVFEDDGSGGLMRQHPCDADPSLQNTGKRELSFRVDPETALRALPNNLLAKPRTNEDEVIERGIHRHHPNRAEKF